MLAPFPPIGEGDKKVGHASDHKSRHGVELASGHDTKLPPRKCVFTHGSRLLLVAERYPPAFTLLLRQSTHKDAFIWSFVNAGLERWLRKKSKTNRSPISKKPSGNVARSSTRPTRLRPTARAKARQLSGLSSTRAERPYPCPNEIDKRAGTRKTKDTTDHGRIVDIGHAPCQ